MASTVFQVVGRFRADTKQFASSMAAASNSMKNFENATQRVAAKTQRVGTALTRFVSLPMLAIGGAASAASIEFESAFIGIRKTVDATESEFMRLEKSVRQMSTTIPVGASELARIGEIAGQLGIEAEGLDKFIKVVADLGQTTTLNVEDGAFALARISNVMGIATDDADRLGSTIVDLGNNFAATENEITRMAERIVGAAKVANITTDEVLAMSTAFAAVGLRAEAGGSSISRVMIQMIGAVREGGEELARYADVAGTSAAEFASTFENKPMEAILQFIEGLERMRQAGGDVFSTLEDLQLSEIRIRDTLLRAAGAGDMLREAVEVGNNAWKENIALTEEANKRYGTTESKLRVVWNRVVEAARAFGDLLAPVLLDVANTIGPMVVGFFELLSGFNDLNPALRKTVLAFAAVALAIGPTMFVIGKAMQLIGGMTSLWASLQTVMLNVAVAVESAAAAMGVSMTVALGVLGVALAAVIGAVVAYKMHVNAADEATHTASEAADDLAASTGMAKREISEMAKVADDAGNKVLAFRKANIDAISTLKDMEQQAAQQYLTEIGINLVASGAGSPEEVFERLKMMAEAADVTIPIDFTPDDIAIDNLVNTVDGVVGRVESMLADNNIAQNSAFLFSIFSKDVQQEVASFGETLAQAMHSGEEGFEQAILAGARFEQQLRNSGMESQQVSNTLGSLLGTLTEVGEFEGVQAGNFAGFIRELGEEGYITNLRMLELLDQTNNLDGETRRFLSAAQRMPGALGDAGVALDDTKTSTEEFAEEVDAATQKVDEHIRKLKALSDPFFAYMDAENQLKDAIAERVAVMEDEESTSADLARAEQAVFESLVNVSAEHARAKATIEQSSGATDALVTILETAADQWGVNLDELGLNVDMLHDYENQILDTPSNVELNIASNTEQMISEVGTLATRLREIDSMVVSPVVRLDTSAGADRVLTQQHTGGFAGTGSPHPGLMSLKHDEVPAVLQKGEFVLSRSMVRQFKSIMKFHDGGYVVKSGDTLSGIAAKVMGDAGAWKQLFEANQNKIDDPNLIFPGQNLTIPHSHGSNTGGSGGSSGGGGSIGGIFPSGSSVGKITQLLSQRGTASGMQKNVDAAREMVEEIERFQREFDRASRRKDLVQNIKEIRQELKGADKEDVEGLRNRLASAKKQLTAFDRETKRMNAELKIQEEMQKALARIEAQRAREALMMEKQKNKQQIRFDNLTREQQISNLTRRMRSEEKYTDEWTQLYNQRKQLMEEERQEAERLNKIFTDLADTIGRKWAGAVRNMSSSDAKFEELAQKATQFQTNWESAITGFAGLVQNLGDKKFVRFENVVDQFAQKIQQAAEFQGKLVQLANMGLDNSLIEQLAAAGPGATALVDALLGGDISQINALQAQLEGLSTTGAGEIFGSMMGTGTQYPEKFDFRVYLDGEEIARRVGEYLAEEISIQTGVS